MYYLNVVTRKTWMAKFSIVIYCCWSVLVGISHDLLVSDAIMISPFHRAGGHRVHFVSPTGFGSIFQIENIGEVLISSFDITVGFILLCLFGHCRWWLIFNEWWLELYEFLLLWEIFIENSEFINHCELLLLRLFKTDLMTCWFFLKIENVTLIIC